MTEEKKIFTKEEYTDKVGEEPTDDDLSQCNCAIVGIPGHTFCGWCEEHDKPRAVCGCSVGDVMYAHSMCCNAHWEIARHDGKLGIYCEKCYKPAGNVILVEIKQEEPAVPPENPFVTKAKAIQAEKDAEAAKKSSETELVKAGDDALPEVKQIKDGECQLCGGEGCDVCSAEKEE